jgi:hypothetical protein
MKGGQSFCPRKISKKKKNREGTTEQAKWDSPGRVLTVSCLGIRRPIAGEAFFSGDHQE